MSGSDTPSIQLLDLEDFITGTATRTAKYEGERYGANTSFFLVDNSPGQGPGLHWHPYPETWVVLEGNVEFVAGDERFEATAGHITTVPAELPHKFTNLGPGTLRMFCIHPSPTIIQHELEQ
ncbi:MAG: cupin domain-containing protein [Actinomycetota bacterium]|nr:cupin domain-containing protein [Actinomycetota bacterium]